MRFEIFRGISLRQLYYNSLGGHSSKKIDKYFTVVEKAMGLSNYRNSINGNARCAGHKLRREFHALVVLNLRYYSPITPKSGAIKDDLCVPNFCVPLRS